LMPAYEEYDRVAEETGWHGPEALFGMMFEYVEPGELLLDVGIGTGRSSFLFHRAGLRVLGMDIDEEMLAAVDEKGFAERLTRHDLTEAPYPYQEGSIDHIICAGVINFCADPTPVFSEAARLLRDGGLLGVSAGDRDADEPAAVEVGPEHTRTGGTVTMYRHTAADVRGLLSTHGLSPVREFEFTAFMDAERARRIRCKAYVARRSPRG